MGSAISKTTWQSFDRYVRNRRAEWRVPGVAIGVVHGESILYQGLHGFADLGRRQKVTASTRFAIASTTKAFTATAAAILVDEHKLDLDAPVRRYLPCFRLKDSLLTDHVTVRDLLCHRTGIPDYSLAWYGSGLSRQQMLDGLRHLDATQDLRQTFQYQNLMYTAAGALIEAVAGMSFERFVQQRIFQPLGMACARFYDPTLESEPHVARGYELEKKGTHRAMPRYDDRATAPAGGIYASLQDMCQWVSMNLDGGQYRGVRVVSEEALRDCHCPHMAIPVIPARAEFMPMAYGMGWWVTGYRGHLRLWHTGGIDGFCARVDLLPRQRVGTVVLANLDAYPIPYADWMNYVLALRAHDTLLGLPPVDYNQNLRKAAKSREVASRRRRGRSGALPGRAGKWAGKYGHPSLGFIEVSEDNGELTVQFRGHHYLMRCEENGDYAGRILCEDVQLRFLKQPQGRLAMELRFGDDGQKVRLTRLPRRRGR